MTQPKPQLRPRRRNPATKNWTWQRLVIVCTAVIGIGILLYPTAAAWFSDRVHATEISGYVDSVKDLTPQTQSDLLEKAHQFNAELPSGPLRDPYSLNDKGEQAVIGAGSEAYKKLLAVGPGDMMGRINIPSIHADLPIFHGTDEDTLAKGAGHLFGSALPVGGNSTHSVLTAHSGFVTATLFDHLNEITQGDTFSISVLNQTIYYKVDQIKTVLPEQTEDLRKVEGKDYVTLVTCTPKGINTHRLLVRGERIDPPTTDNTQTMPSQATDPGFPWWALTLTTATTLAILATRPRRQEAIEEPAVEPESVSVDGLLS